MQGIVINGISKCKEWKICMKNMHSICWNTMQILEERIPKLAKVPSNYTNQIGSRGLYMVINPCSFFHPNVICTYTYKAHKKLVSVPKNEMPTKACTPFFQTLWAFRFCISFFETLAIIFILFYFIFPRDTWLVLDWYHRKKKKQLKEKTSNGLSWCVTLCGLAIYIKKYL